MRNDSRCRHAAQGAETNGRGWWGLGVDDVQVDCVPLQERMWGAGETERCYDNKRLLIGSGRMEEGTENDPETFETGGAGGDRISVNC